MQAPTDLRPPDRRRRARRPGRRRGLHRARRPLPDGRSRRAWRSTPPATSPVRRTSTSTPPSPRTPGPRGRHPLPEVAVFEAAMRAAGCQRRPPGRGVRRLGRAGPPPGAGGCCAGPGIATCACSTAAGRPGWLPAAPGLDGRGDAAARRLHRATRAAAGPRGRRRARVRRARTCSSTPATPERFRGEVEPVDPVAGHIPGAVNVPTGANLASRRPVPHRRRAAPRSTPAARDEEVAAYCGSGVTAAHDILAMAVAGIDATLYPGSWSEWVADPQPDDQRPVATGD